MSLAVYVYAVVNRQASTTTPHITLVAIRTRTRKPEQLEGEQLNITSTRPIKRPGDSPLARSSPNPTMLTDDLPWPELGNVSRGATRGVGGGLRLGFGSTSNATDGHNDISLGWHNTSPFSRIHELGLPVLQRRLQDSVTHMPHPRCVLRNDEFRPRLYIDTSKPTSTCSCHWSGSLESEAT